MNHDAKNVDLKSPTTLPEFVPFQTMVLPFNASDTLDKAVQLLKQNDVVAIPTETVYGLAGNAFSDVACAKIFAAKGRPSDNPLIVHVCDDEMLKSVVDFSSYKAASSDVIFEMLSGDFLPKIYRQLIDAFWPGPLTLIFPKSALISSLVSGRRTHGLIGTTVAVRQPALPATLQLIRAANLPLAAPSANTSGAPSPTSAAHVMHDLHGKIPLIVDGSSQPNSGSSSAALTIDSLINTCQEGIESTVLHPLLDPPLILRPGTVTLEQIRELLPSVQLYQSDSSLPTVHPQTAAVLQKNDSICEPVLSPGMKYTHYSPNAMLVLLDCPESNASFLSLVSKICALFSNSHQDVAMLCTDVTIFNNSSSHPSIRKYLLGTGNPACYHAIARDLFQGIRSLDAENPKVILMPCLPLEKEALGIMNRVMKAATLIIKNSNILPLVNLIE